LKNNNEECAERLEKKPDWVKISGGSAMARSNQENDEWRHKRGNIADRAGPAELGDAAATTIRGGGAIPMARFDYSTAIDASKSYESTSIKREGEMPALAGRLTDGVRI